MYALNLPLSSENNQFWESADPVVVGAGDTEIALYTSGSRHPGVSDSIESRLGGIGTRASETPKGPW